MGSMSSPPSRRKNVRRNLLLHRPVACLCLLFHSGRIVVATRRPPALTPELLLVSDDFDSQRHINLYRHVKGVVGDLNVKGEDEKPSIWGFEDEMKRKWFSI
ncbi:hypothetical protein L1987_57851 [Smallanthus sonchifolius]|uniref:Uncharacterized protein n=1 Tax=Smallanthus sonchifolius TaxID=185202 RepID=A0ACB9DEA9_9ASTR|nr:hypothetical protein L1987_57851 [Smallanthus sonchifolius]